MKSEVSAQQGIPILYKFRNPSFLLCVSSLKLFWSWIGRLSAAANMHRRRRRQRKMNSFGVIAYIGYKRIFIDIYSKLWKYEVGFFFISLAPAMDFFLPWWQKDWCMERNGNELTQPFVSDELKILLEKEYGATCCF